MGIHPPRPQSDIQGESSDQECDEMEYGDMDPQYRKHLASGMYVPPQQHAIVWGNSRGSHVKIPMKPPTPTMSIIEDTRWRNQNHDMQHIDVKPPQFAQARANNYNKSYDIVPCDTCGYMNRSYWKFCGNTECHLSNSPKPAATQVAQTTGLSDQQLCNVIMKSMPNFDAPPVWFRNIIENPYCREMNLIRKHFLKPKWMDILHNKGLRHLPPHIRLGPGIGDPALIGLYCRPLESTGFAKATSPFKPSDPPDSACA